MAIRRFLLILGVGASGFLVGLVFGIEGSFDYRLTAMLGTLLCAGLAAWDTRGRRSI